MVRKPLVPCLALVVMALLWAAPPVAAQIEQARINGTVADAQLREGIEEAGYDIAA